MKLPVGGRSEKAERIPGKHQLADTMFHSTMVEEGGRVTENLFIDFGENASIGSKAGRDILTPQQEADCPDEESLECRSVDQFIQTRHVRCREDEHVAELTGQVRKGIRFG